VAVDHDTFARDIARAVAAEHSGCMDRTCYVRAALVAGLPLTAAWILWHSTETPLIDQVLRTHSPPTRWAAHTEERAWEAHVRRHSRRCALCSVITFTRPGEAAGVCDRCGGPLLQPTDPLNIRRWTSKADAAGLSGRYAS
jgi:hypothetical protein